MNKDINNKCDVFKMIDDYIKEENHKGALKIIDEYISEQERMAEISERIARIYKRREAKHGTVYKILSVIFHYGIPLGALVILLMRLF